MSKNKDYRKMKSIRKVKLKNRRVYGTLMEDGDLYFAFKKLDAEGLITVQTLRLSPEAMAAIVTIYKDFALDIMKMNLEKEKPLDLADIVKGWTGSPSREKALVKDIADKVDQVALNSHGRVVCSECRRVLASCRCFLCGDIVQYMVCDDCKKEEEKK